MGDRVATAQLQAFLRASAAAGRDAVRIEPFEAYFDRTDEMKYLNYAVPDDGANPSLEAIESLRVAFRARSRLPRLEWIAEAAPAVAAALAGAGMSEELATPLMACTHSELRVPDVDAEIARVSAGDTLEAHNVQRVAFGQEPVEEASERELRTVLARIDGRVVAAAGWTAVVGGVSEIVGVATAAPFRGRGLAGALTAAAAEAAFLDGAELCVLSPGDETAQRVYARAGFRRVATMLHWSDA
ncbi:MAG TPA: GNAT family N-acetyltransferase [Thermoleophilaceae bacterium]|nr:GNAT family N-acetyltransferase [Thermoleophilaceae bacterium]